MNLMLFTVQTECSMTSDSDSEDESTSTKLSFASICKFTTYFREVTADHIMETQRDHKISGVGMHVEIDHPLTQPHGILVKQWEINKTFFLALLGLVKWSSNSFFKCQVIFKLLLLRLSSNQSVNQLSSNSFQQFCGHLRTRFFCRLSSNQTCFIISLCLVQGSSTHFK